MLININTMLILLWHGHYANYQPNSEAFFLLPQTNNCIFLPYSSIISFYSAFLNKYP